jgi:hypothetical protein
MADYCIDIKEETVPIIEPTPIPIYKYVLWIVKCSFLTVLFLIGIICIVSAFHNVSNTNRRLDEEFNDFQNNLNELNNEWITNFNQCIIDNTSNTTTSFEESTTLSLNTIKCQQQLMFMLAIGSRTKDEYNHDYINRFLNRIIVTLMEINYSIELKYAQIKYSFSEIMYRLFLLKK